MQGNEKRVSGNQIWRHHFPALFITIYVRTGSFLHCPFIKPCRNFLYDPVQVKCAGDFQEDGYSEYAWINTDRYAMI